MEKQIFKIAKKALPNALFSELFVDSDHEFSFKIAPEPGKVIFVDLSITSGILYAYIVYASVLAHGREIRQQKIFSGAAPLLKNGNLDEDFMGLLFAYYSCIGR